MKTLWIIIGGYLLGSILFGKIFLKLLKDKDIRKESSDGNPGTFKGADPFVRSGKGSASGIPLSET